MKQCPKCNFTCEDNDIICKNCGYLFNVTGYGADDPANSQDGSQSQQTPNGQQGYGNSQQPYGGQPNANPYGSQQAPYGQQNPYGNNPYGGPDYNNPYSAYPQNNGGYVEQKNDGMAIASLVLGILGCTCCSILITSILAIVFGFISRSKIAQSNNTLKGNGMAIAGIILGFIGIGIFILSIVLVASGAYNFNDILNQYESSAY